VGLQRFSFASVAEVSLFGILLSTSNQVPVDTISTNPNVDTNPATE
jgi:hypothetical protein